MLVNSNARAHSDFNSKTNVPNDNYSIRWKVLIVVLPCRVPKQKTQAPDFKPFALGQIFITSGAKGVLSHLDITKALARHAQGEWGDVDEHDRQANNQAIHQESRLLSVYHDSITGTKYWIMTEADRSSTTLLLPAEY